MAADERLDAAALVDQDELIELTKGICRIPSPLGEEGAVAQYTAEWMERQGWEVDLQEVVVGRPNVVAISRGAPEYQSFLLNGHLDMPMPFGQWRHDPFDPWVEDGVLYGAGIQDMKGGTAALIAAATAVARAGIKERGDIIVTAVMHHDTIGLGTKYFLDACPWRIDAAINGEPTNLAVQLFHGGAWGFEITLRGIGRHHVLIEEGVSAVEGMARVISRVSRDSLTFTPDPRHPDLPSIVIGRVDGGEYNTMTAARATARGDARWLPSMSVDGMKADLQRVVDQVCAEMPGLSGKVSTFRQQWPYETSVEEPVVQRVIRAHTREFGRAPKITTGLPLSRGITDTADIVRRGIPAALYGPSEWRTEPDEGIAVRDLVGCARVYAATCAESVTQRRG